MKPKKRPERHWLSTYARDWLCYLRRRHSFEGWLAPPMPRLRRESGLPYSLFRCRTCGQEVLRYPDGHEEWL